MASASTETAKSVYDELVAAGCRVGSHESDLYVKADDTSRRIIRAALAEKRLANRPTLFQSQAPEDNGALWYEIAFGYRPFWDKRLKGGE